MSMDLTLLNKKFPGGLHESSMIDTDYKKGNIHWVTFDGAQCPICHHTDWCLVNATGTKVICMRSTNDNKPKVAGGHLFNINGGKKVEFDPSKVNNNLTVTSANDDQKDVLYRLVLLAYPLAKHHYDALINRGLTSSEILLHGTRGFGSFYKSKKGIQEYNISPFKAAKFDISSSNKGYVNSQWKVLLENVGVPTESWKGVPGFYLKKIKLEKSISFEYDRGNKKYDIEPGVYSYPVFSGSTDGMLIPYYNLQNEIVGFQTRVDHVSIKAKITEKPKNWQVKVYFAYGTNKYHVKVFNKANPYGKEIAHGIISNKSENPIIIKCGVLGNDKIVFKPVYGGKYYWVSSANKLMGSSDKTPIQVAYQHTIAKLKPYDKKLIDYINEEKAVWLTEGGLKALVASAKLPNNFSEEDLNRYGHDFLAVAGVASYKKFIPALEKLHVKRVTVAFDMDFIKNPQVSDHYKSMINLLHEKGYKVTMALWDPKKAKGIDDALVARTEIRFKEI
ncbi:DUF3854 domain-containing protein (plasmid) [Limosilactobacillus reuteri]|uniref:DUF3854 domain-containing protein n=1 Tax=Limosilactobacillus reuteri TaxID=1598 RepID=UPI0039BF1330